ncbi:UDP-2,3-diacylglucosamine diphosphatase [Marinomonas mediterranea]|uniref:UDP-2,3-diacylglucosamine diphosphatase n=1 Tax=Marinomonas mediterranea TaxID=119864 RepID=UPI00234B9BF3|nr:UDP-2,3-diacylglucosamine diphosphatase [Marinomonas mediterranea]WCN09472.1 UDP-2,3-diacylglucosamine diphosphatase [Marinomonas mediterranea]
MTDFFISDLHLYDKRPDLIRAFVVLTDEIKKYPDSTLYILGDFYEAWIGDDYQPPWNKDIETALTSLRASGHSIKFIHGNRDFLIKHTWCERTGAELLEEISSLNHRGNIICLAHGDEFCTDDIDYQQFRAQNRTEAWQSTVLAMPIEQRLALAQQLRNDSKSMSADKESSIMDVNENTIASTMHQQGASVLIHGHTHRPKLHDQTFGKRLVLGDWDTFVWVAKLEDNSLSQARASVESFCEKGFESLDTQHALQL